MGMYIYGPTYPTINVHSLLHLIDDYKKWGVLDNSSAFIFEIYLGYLKKLVRHGKEPLKQVVARLHESSSADQPKLVDKPKDQEFCCKPPGNVFISIMDNCPVIIKKRTSNMYEVNVL
ncbi:uncharacterized protein LOC111713343 [Eurytemora carolleeae]|uniref:uncharacterized protein LOC111713343 n=1 Tax=Eurytemora carolleeae TaxID=1294199 RepID=UPI000C779953|nr:uncharacterized protein LOC111713343 [Eurytemora carolleeae]|eukprot:XP_023343963.1 uncharacterized protein LOC111713343 [Eurytemora affinis]